MLTDTQPTDYQQNEPSLSSFNELFHLEGISKQFPGVLALDKVDFDLKAGEVHVLFGENGAGKSTLISIIAGACQPTSGRIIFQGREVELQSVHTARNLGISAVFQEFSLVPQFTVAQNLSLGAEAVKYGLLDKQAMRQRAEQTLRKLGFSIRPDQRVSSLSRAEQQMVEIAKAFRAELSVLILDEPTASLTEKETKSLFALIEQAKAEGVAIIYITHRIAEIHQVADRVTVLRDGNHIATVNAADVTDDQLLELMTGRVIEQVFPHVNYAPAETLLKVQNLSTASGVVQNVSFTVRRGEIVGFAGLVGAGKSDVARACFGVEPVSAGEVWFDGENVTGLPPRKMLDRGMFYVPSDRRNEGLVMLRGARENISLPSLNLPKFSRFGFLKLPLEKRITHQLGQQLNLQPLNLERPLEYFSGGNQQKALLAKTLTREVKLFIFDEPTVGVDVGTRVAIYQFIGKLCEAGAAILLISSDLPEVLHLANRAYVFHRGKLRAELRGSEITEENVLGHFFAEEKSTHN